MLLPETYFVSFGNVDNAYIALLPFMSAAFSVFDVIYFELQFWLLLYT